ncbi:pyridoxal-5'-phosphate-dependent protein [Pilimelia anulata]|uniref:Pyridoxal-5'-phosphate-dependent protein n=1 Tax=Pilimelia anulata TaxID=53371 RepID=A0A8J3B7R4_9ACTN|nr:aminotransferase class I/II-fold pyridoxal phosphate-dependent enzyme [Pilimelia anulata]GGJ91550.1 pyridoxal-5'-phosphate-dependent protein [Pilimelia anulata]
MTRVLLSPPDIGPLEEEYVLRALRSDWPAPGGPEVARFEDELAASAGVPHVVAVSSGTAALHLALLAAGIGPGDEVAVPTLTFAATVHAVRYTGARPVLVDVDPADGTLDPELLADVLAARPAVRAVVPVDLFGRCADHARLEPACAAAGAALVVDAAESLGAARHGVPAGAAGRAAAFSFNGNKIITTSGGGAVATADAALADRCRHLANQARLPVPHYEHDELGYNYRLSALLAALGRAQLRRLPELLKRRRAIRERYVAALAGRPGVRLPGADDPDANCWLTPLLVDPADAGWTAGALAAHLAAAGVETRPMWRPMHRQPANAGLPAYRTGVADRWAATGLMLPNGSATDDAALDHLFGALRAFPGWA